MIHESIHADAAFNTSEFGAFEIKQLNRLISTRNRVVNSIILPATISGSIRKLA